MESINDILKKYSNNRKVFALQEKINSDDLSTIQVKGIAGSSLAFIAASVFKLNKRSQLFILPTKEQAAYFQNDLQSMFENKEILFFADSFKKAGSFDRTERTNILMRTEVIERLYLRGRSKVGEIIVTYPEALIEKVINKSTFKEHIIEIKKDETLDVDFLNEMLSEWNFERVDFVEEAGQYAIRGGIVDVFSYSEELPYRIELFDDEIESIRVFDLDTQLSTESLEKAIIIPDTHSHFLEAKHSSILDCIPGNTSIWMNNTHLLYDTWEKNTEQLKQTFEFFNQEKFKGEKDEFWENCKSVDKLFDNAESIKEHIAKFNRIEYGESYAFIPDAQFDFNIKPQTTFNKNFNLLIDALKHNADDKINSYIFSSNKKQIERFYAIFEDSGEQVKFTPSYRSINEGFNDPDNKISCYSDHQIFNRFNKYNLRRSYGKSSMAAVKALKELKPGDFVTHTDFGVGKYAGIIKSEKEGVLQETIKIVFKDGDTVYVNINALHKVSKHSGKDGTEPKLTRLGSGSWEKTKAKTKKRVKDIAEDLIKLYAKRKGQKGFAFSPDTYLQTELEASFFYEDTPDQFKATQDVKFDMEQEHPMDRLVCGDVGFGKTEVAIRAAFKAATDGKQVAVLVPTTILAYQHYISFKERLKDFPVEVDYMNRFKTKKEQTEVIKGLKSGKIDIVIGTHRLLGKEIDFKDLGLFVIDEEQKFGVAHKEKLKNLKVNVDTLTLTATPIPRTLQFSLLGARDLSVINTPPPNRQGIQTEIHTFNQDIIADAINFEVNRGGQVFFVHNKVKDIMEIKTMINSLCPHVKIAVAHGQMDGKDLEKVFMDFMEEKFDVLLATSLIESGIDIPNANTMIIHNANHFGLSDLHQLRGRVGRSNKKAFCYLLSPPLHALTADARKRLKTIEEFSDLGSGFNVAMRDMDIRGAGNLLGGEQSGFVNDLGIDAYHKILEETLQELKETEFKDLFKEEILRKQEFVRDTQIETDFEILIPDRYINNINERLSIYNRLDNAKNEDELRLFKLELIDRFGPIPPQVEEIFQGIRLRWTCKRLGIERVIMKNKNMRCVFTQNQDSPFYESATFTNMLNFVQKNSDRCKLKQTPKYLMLSVSHVVSLGKADSFLKRVNEKVVGA